MKDLEIKDYEEKCIKKECYNECRAIICFAGWERDRLVKAFEKTENKICNLITDKDSPRVVKELDRLIEKANNIRKNIDYYEERITIKQEELVEIIEEVK